MGWIGDAKRVEECLQARADKDEEGRFLVRGGRIVTGLGGQEMVVDDETEIRVKGEWEKLVPLLYGGFRITVI